MATALKLRSDIKKLKKALDTKGISASIKDKLKSQLSKAEGELASLKKGKKPSVSTTGGTKTALSKLQSIIKKKKYGAYRAQGVDLKKDAERPALPTGKRKSKSGNTYYEYRANRIDVKQPPKRYPKLEKGGYMAKGGKVEDELYVAEYRKGEWTVKDKKNPSANYTLSTKKENAESVRKELINKPSLLKYYRKNEYAKGGVTDHYKDFDFDSSGNLSAQINGKKYSIIYRDDESKMYDLFEDDKKIKSGQSVRELMKFKDGGYMAGGGNVLKKYEKIDGTDYELKIQVYYDKGGMNYFTSRPEARGYYLSVSPVQVERRENGIMVESYAAFSGIKALVLPVQRQSPKAEKQAEELAVKMMPELKEQVTSNLKRKLGLMAEGGVMETREILSEEQQMAKGGQLDDLLSKQSEFLAQLTDIKLEADLETEEGVLNYRNQIAPIKEKLSLIENELEELGYEAYEKGGYMAKGGMTLGDISKKYDKNEDINYHTENVVLLATHFGTESELRDAKTIKAKHDAIGHLPFNLYEERNELGDKLYKRMQEQIRENGMGAKPKKVVAMVSKEYVNPNYMAKGGEMHRYEKGGEMAKGGIIELESVGVYFRPSDLATSTDGTFSEDDIFYLSDIDNYEWWHGLSKEDRAKIEEHFDVDKYLMNKFDTIDLNTYDKEAKEMKGGGYMAKGGYMAEGGKTLIGKEFRPFTATSSNEYNVEIVDIDLDNVTYKYKDGEVKKAKTSDFLNSYIQVKEKGGYMAEGGMSQGYDDREDERLGMRDGKIADKDFVGTHSQMEHSRRDDAQFEERNN